MVTRASNPLTNNVSTWIFEGIALKTECQLLHNLFGFVNEVRLGCKKIETPHTARTFLLRIMRNKPYTFEKNFSAAAEEDCTICYMGDKIMSILSEKPPCVSHVFFLDKTSNETSACATFCHPASPGSSRNFVR